MTLLTWLHAADYPQMPWKNGAGTTTEIARDHGAEHTMFGWRLSVADVNASGGFSDFSGYQRIITVLQGEGMVLTVDAQPTPPLRVFEPFAFDGASSVFCELQEGAIRDFNLIYAPQQYAARLQWFTDDQPVNFYTPADMVLVFSASPQLMVQVDAHLPVTLGLHDTLQIDNATAALQHISFAGCGCVIELTPNKAAPDPLR